MLTTLDVQPPRQEQSIVVGASRATAAEVIRLHEQLLATICLVSRHEDNDDTQGREDQAELRYRCAERARQHEVCRFEASVEESATEHAAIFLNE